MFATTIIARRTCSTAFDLAKDILRTVQQGHGCVLPKVNVLEAGNGNLLVDFQLEENHLNRSNSLHGGFSATPVDIFCACALMTHERSKSKSVISVDMHVTYFKPAVVGDKILVDTKILRVGRSMGFVECEIRNKTTNDLLVKGSQTLALSSN